MGLLDFLGLWGDNGSNFFDKSSLKKLLVVYEHLLMERDFNGKLRAVQNIGTTRTFKGQ